jgi:predicted ribosome quality control (RQC) complex YloA/Tae2 family protein
MSLNWREIALILSELPLEGSSIQKTHQIGYHALVFEMYHSGSGRWELYVEVGTNRSRLHRLTAGDSFPKPKKTVRLQRFIQFMRARVEGARVVSVTQDPGDRLVVLQLDQHGESMVLVFRLYSGAGANIIVCDGEMTILDLLLRRPARDEMSNRPLVLQTRTEPIDDNRFPVRERIPGSSFNEQIEREYRTEDAEGELSRLLAQVTALKEKELGQLRQTIATLERRISETSSYDSYKRSAELLGASMHLVKPKTEWVEVPDYYQENGSTALIALDPSLTAGENVEAYYKKYQKGKRTLQNLQEEFVSTKKQLELTAERFETLLTPDSAGVVDVDLLRKACGGGPLPDTRKDPLSGAPGLRFMSGPYTILVGRNAKENDELLRQWTRGNDFWMHTRDVPGGYVFIKSIAKKTIPLETLLDAATLALLYSKAKESRKADLYYTQVKYLRRVKDGKTGLVIPTQEKNFSIEMDDKRVQRLFSTGEHDPSAV